MNASWVGSREQIGAGSLAREWYVDADQRGSRAALPDMRDAILPQSVSRHSLTARQWTPECNQVSARLLSDFKEETLMRRQEIAFAKACLVGAVAAVFGCASFAVHAQDLKKYE